MNRVVISMLGTKLDQKGSLDRRWASWRPNLSLVSHANFPVNHFILLHQPHDEPLALLTIDDLKIVSPNTKFERYTVNYRDPWNFESVYAELHDFALAHQFDPEVDDVYVNISTGTHVVQICLFLLTESRYLPAKLLQTSPDKQNPNGKLYFIDLNLSSYDQISARFAQQQWHHTQLLKQGIDTRNQAFNQLIQLIEKISVSSKAPLLLTGETGVGKSKMASLIYQLKKQRGQVSGQFVEVNCATLRGDQAMSSLFGHRKGAFTGALMARAGFLMQANQGLLFLDEIGELGLDEQAMLLRAIEDKSFTPLGSDQAVSSDFQLIAGTNRSLSAMVLQGKFREDLLARINVWTIELPSLRQRLDDIEPNISFELQQMTRQLGYKVSMNHHAKERYLTFAMQEDSLWRGNFRDLSVSI